jgi:hypothetical protein
MLTKSKNTMKIMKLNALLTLVFVASSSPAHSASVTWSGYNSDVPADGGWLESNPSALTGGDLAMVGSGALNAISRTENNWNGSGFTRNYVYWGTVSTYNPVGVSYNEFTVDGVVLGDYIGNPTPGDREFYLEVRSDYSPTIFISDAWQELSGSGPIGFRDLKTFNPSLLDSVFESVPAGTTINWEIRLRTSTESSSYGYLRFAELDYQANEVTGTLDTWTRISATPIPEPSTSVLGGLGLLTILCRRKRS